MIEFAEALFVLFFSWIFLSFIYHCILAPSFRLTLELDLYELRDEVKLLKAGSVEPVTMEASAILQESIEVMICKLDRIILSSLLFVEFESRRDPEFLTMARDRARMLEESPVQCIRLLRQRALQIAKWALIVNSIEYAVLLIIPAVSDAAKERLRVLTALRVPDFHQAIPQERRRWERGIKNA